MKKTLSILALVLTGALASAQMMDEPRPMHGFWGLHSDYALTEKKAIEQELGSQKLGDLTVNQLIPLRDRLNIAEQKDAYVRHAVTASFVVPGMGQFKEGDVGAGAGFFALNVGVEAGTLIWAYYALPADLKFDQLNYWNSSFTQIHNTWGNHSISDVLPSVGILAVGALVDLAVRGWSAHDAYVGAKSAIDSGKVEFQPIASPGMLGMNFHF